MLKQIVVHLGGQYVRIDIVCTAYEMFLPLNVMPRRQEKQNDKQNNLLLIRCKSVFQQENSSRVVIMRYFLPA